MTYIDYNLLTMENLSLCSKILYDKEERRKEFNYDSNTKLIIELKKQNILNDIKILDLEEKSIIYDNQRETAGHVVANFKNRKIINQMIIGMTQSGKTGTMLSVIKTYLEDSCNIIPIENIYIITGLSSLEWKNQTKIRFPKSIENNIYHRCQLPMEFIEEIKNKKNILVIIDEIQIAAKKHQTIYKAFKDIGFYNLKNLLEKDIKILEFTATPDGTIYDLMKWEDYSSMIISNSGENYISSFYLLDNGYIKQYRDLLCYNKKEEKVNYDLFNENIKEVSEDIKAYSNSKYHIFRTPVGKKQDIYIENFKSIFNEEEYNYIFFDLNYDSSDINTILDNEPDKHTFIFIKEMLRCAKTINKKYIGVLYERFTEKNSDDTVIIQGLLGRITGYYNINKIVCYTNIYSIEKYRKLWNSNFKDKKIKWKSKTTKIIKGILNGNNTFNSKDNFDDIETSSQDSDEIKEPIIIKRKTQKEIKEFYNKELKSKFNGRGPNTRKPNKYGFYESVIGKGSNRKRIRTTNEIYEVRKWSLNETHNYTFYPCYKNINNKSTLEWWLIYYE